MVTDKLCPMTKTGFHKRKPWHDPIGHRSGFACEKCHKTWQYVGDELVEGYELWARQNAD